MGSVKWSRCVHILRVVKTIQVCLVSCGMCPCLLGSKYENDDGGGAGKSNQGTLGRCLIA